MPDRDEFLNATKAAQGAIQEVGAWLSDPANDPTLMVERLLADALKVTGGVPEYIGDLRDLLQSIADEPLLHDDIYGALDAVEAFFTGRCTSVVDQLLARGVAASIALRIYAPEKAMINAVCHMAEALIIDARGGLVGMLDVEDLAARRGHLQECFRPAAGNIVRKLMRNEPGSILRTPTPGALDLHEDLLRVIR